MNGVLKCARHPMYVIILYMLVAGLNKRTFAVYSTDYYKYFLSIDVYLFLLFEKIFLKNGLQ